MTSGVVGWLHRWRSEIVHATYDRIRLWGNVGSHHSRASRYGHFGDGTLIGFPFGTVYGEQWMHLGSDTLVADHVTMSVGMLPGQQMVSNPVLRIGDRCLIGRYNAIVAHFSVEIGDDVFTGMNVYITDQNHTYEDLDLPIGRQWPVEDPVRIGSGSWIGSGAVILPGAQIGRHVVVAANSVVRGVIPDHCVVAGVPARIVRRHDGAAWQRSGDEGRVVVDETGRVSGDADDDGVVDASSSDSGS